MNDFFPDGYDIPKAPQNYMKFEDGANKFRCLSKPIFGWLDWETDKDGKRKPIRFTFDNKPKESIDPSKPFKHFWAFVVYNRQDKLIQILEIKQKTIQVGIQNIVSNEDWGSPMEYDITVTKSGKELTTEYSITPSPKKPLEKEIQDELKSKNIDLNLLFEGKDPFDGKVIVVDDGEVF